MRTIYRYDVPHGDPVKIWIGGDPKAVAATPTGVEFWAERDLDGRSLRERVFFIVGTGHDIPNRAKYWGTAPRTPDGFVWHLYEQDHRVLRGVSA